METILPSFPIFKCRESQKNKDLVCFSIVAPNRIIMTETGNDLIVLTIRIIKSFEFRTTKNLIVKVSLLDLASNGVRFEDGTSL